MTAQDQSQDLRGNRKRVQGLVVSDVNDKTVVVQVTEQLRHPLYGKFVKRTKKFHAHDEKNDANKGDTIQIIETRPLSAKKRWRLEKVLERAV
jgi:small subunit ribosomal protein S17